MQAAGRYWEVNKPWLAPLLAFLMAALAVVRYAVLHWATHGPPLDGPPPLCVCVAAACLAGSANACLVRPATRGAWPDGEDDYLPMVLGMACVALVALSWAVAGVSQGGPGVFIERLVRCLFLSGLLVGCGFFVTLVPFGVCELAKLNPRWGLVAGSLASLLCLQYALLPGWLPWLREGINNWFHWLGGHFA